VSANLTGIFGRHRPADGKTALIDGDAGEMRPGDLILTPNWTWHDQAVGATFEPR
jgi:gentisate 1,2-dioxygenase